MLSHWSYGPIEPVPGRDPTNRGMAHHHHDWQCNSFCNTWSKRSPVAVWAVGDSGSDDSRMAASPLCPLQLQT